MTFVRYLEISNILLNIAKPTQMKNNKTDVLALIRCTPEFRKMVEDMAEPLGLNRSAYIRLLIIQEAERQGIEKIVRS